MKRGLVALAAALVASCGTAHVSGPPPAPLRSVEAYGRPDVDPLLEAGRTITGEAIRYPASPSPLVVAERITIAPGQSTGWHRHAAVTFGHILSGTLEVEYATGERRVLRAGDSLLESMDVPHNAVNVAAEPVRILAVFMGAQGKASVVKTDPPSMPAGLGGSRASDLVDLAAVDPALRLDIRYATPDNFTGEIVYPVARALLQRPAAEALSRANRRAREKGYGLLILDAYRPWSVTRMFWDRFPTHRAYLADPLAGSRHNRGCAVDLTLFDLASGREVSMPSAYDEFSEKAHPMYAGGTPAERKARDVLRGIMESEGFTVYENEWWHFDYTGWHEWPVLDVSLDSADRSRR